VEPKPKRTVPGSILRAGLLTFVMQLSLAGCAGLTNPAGPQTIAGDAPVGTVALTETFVTGVAGGSGTLTFQGQRYPFRVFGSVIGPGGGASKISAEGDVYNLTNVADFAGPYTQRSGKAGLSTSGASDLWLQNKAGVVMHLRGTENGVLLTLGREEILVRMEQ
jgi:hypothetical protein